MNQTRNSLSTQRIERVYYLLLSLFWFATALPLALSILLMTARGLNLFQVSLWMGVYSLTVVLLEVPTGGLADAIGRKKVALLAYSCIILSGLIFLFAFVWPMFLLMAVVYGLGRALSSGALDAWFVDALQAVNPEVDLQPALAKANTFSLLALGLGLLLGSSIPNFFNWLPAEGTAVLTPLVMPLLLAVLAQIMLLTLTALLVQENRPAADELNWRQGFREVPKILRIGFTLTQNNPILLLLFGATLASGFVLSSLETFWQPHFAQLLGGSEGNSLFFGIIMGGNFVVGMVGNMLATPLSRWLRQRYGLLCAIFQGVRGLMLILLAVQTQTPLAVVFFWLVYFNMGLVNSPHAALLNGQIPTKQRSAMLSIESLVGYLGAIVGSVGLGYIAEHASIGAAWIIAGGILVVSLGLYMRIDVYQRDTKPQPQLGQSMP